MMPSRQPLLSTPQLVRSPWLRLGGLLVIAAMLAGCGHKKVANAGAPGVSQDDPNQALSPADQSAAVTPATVPSSPDGGADLRALNHAYIGWIVQTHQRVTSFEQFVSISGIKVPPPPAGKKYVIDHAGFIAIQNQ